MSEISNICNTVEGHCLQAMGVMHHHAIERFDWLISGQENVNLTREAISIFCMGNTIKDLRLSILSLISHCKTIIALHYPNILVHYLSSMR